MIAALVAGDAQAAALAAGCEEEGVPLTVRVDPDAGDALARGRRAARDAELGIGVGGDAAGLVVVLAAAPGRPYVETADARAAGRAAARIAARRPL
jgi:hypothetical protein